MEEEKKIGIMPESTGNKQFRVPDGYFDLLPQRIMEFAETDGVRQKEPRLIKLMKPLVGLAAAFALIMMLVYAPLKFFSPGVEAKNETAHIDVVDFITSNMDELIVFEALDANDSDAVLDDEQLETFLMGAVNEYDLIVLNDR